MYWVVRVLLAFIPWRLSLWFAKRYCGALIARAKRTPYFHLPGYMDRYWLFRNFLGMSARVHVTYRSDEDLVLHDHPWDNISLLLDGYYWEKTFDRQPSQWPGALPPLKSKLYMVGDIVARRAEKAHRLELSYQVVTLFITFGKRRPWGFYTAHGWVYWRQYLKGSELENELAHESNG